MPVTKTRAHCTAYPIPKTGAPQRGGRLDNYLANRDTNTHPRFKDGLVYVSVEGLHPRKAIIAEADYQRITSADQSGPRLTRSRWWLDDDNMLRAYSLHEKPMRHGLLVAAVLLDAKAGDCLELPADPLDLRRTEVMRVAQA